MPPLSLPVLRSGKPTVWEEAIYASLVEKRGRSGSTRTVESYARMLWPFSSMNASPSETTRSMVFVAGSIRTSRAGPPLVLATASHGNPSTRIGSPPYPRRSTVATTSFVAGSIRTSMVLSQQLGIQTACSLKANPLQRLAGRGTATVAWTLFVSGSIRKTADAFGTPTQTLPRPRPI